jgi:hypothetical protein
MKRALTVLLAILVVAGPGVAAAAEIQPHMAGWERIFSIGWQPVNVGGRPVVEGYVNNVSPYELTRIQILVEGLDASGKVTAQKIAYLPGDLLGGGRLYFQVPSDPAPSYRVRIYTYDRIERDGTFR